jgi:hypothetical protein
MTVAQSILYASEYSNGEFNMMYAIRGPSIISFCHPQWSWWLSCLPLEPKFMDSNPTEGDGLLWAIKVCSTTSFKGEVKLLTPCRKIFGMSKNLTGMKKIFHRQNSSFHSPFHPALLLGDF